MPARKTLRELLNKGPVFAPCVYDCISAKMVEEAGFEVELLEYCDENGDFHYRHWNEADGRIGRSLRFDTRNSWEEGKLGMVSVIVDAKKPKIIRAEE